MTKTLKPSTAQLTLCALLLAVLFTWQYVTMPLGLTFVTGAGVNLLLAYCVIACGVLPGVALAALSPIIAQILGFEPSWALVPFIAVANVALVLIWHFVARGNLAERDGLKRMTVATVVSALAKFLVLLGSTSALSAASLLPYSEAVSATSYALPHLAAAIIGGAIAALLLHTQGRQSPL